MDVKDRCRKLILKWAIYNSSALTKGLELFGVVMWILSFIDINSIFWIMLMFCRQMFNIFSSRYRQWKNICFLLLFYKASSSISLIVSNKILSRNILQMVNISLYSPLKAHLRLSSNFGFYLLITKLLWENLHFSWRSHQDHL